MLGKWLVTSAWPYINYMPHLGTMIGSVLSADVVARYLRLKGEEVVFVSGSDEHGTPIEIEAIRLNKKPKELTDENHAAVKKLFERWGISFENYTRTESPTHKKFVQEILLDIYNRGFVFTEENDHPFCPNCERFLPDRFIQGECPRCGFKEAKGDQCESCGWPLEPSKLINSQCAICGGIPQIKKTKHWYFDLPKLGGELRKFIQENRNLPNNAKNFSLKFIEDGLRPRALTRDSEWGIPAPFPGAEGKTIYVWIEAVLGYISATIEYFHNHGTPEKWKDFWMDPNAKTIYFIGKDNIPFHTIILPALLLASGKEYTLPWTVCSTEFLLFKGQKFSKSRRLGIWIDEALQMFPPDYWRYTLLSIRPESKDTNFTQETFIEKVNSDLNDTLGNFVHRTLTFVDRYFQGSVPNPIGLDEYDLRMLDTVNKTMAELDSNMSGFKLQAYISAAMNFAHLTNKYMNDKEPWKTIKRKPSEAATSIYVSIQLVKALALIIAPLTPETSEKIWKMLNLKGSVHESRLSEVTERIEPGCKIVLPKPLFRKISQSEINRF